MTKEKATVLRKTKAAEGLYRPEDVERIWVVVSGGLKHTGRLQFRPGAKPVRQDELQEPNKNVAVYLCGPSGAPELRELRSDGLVLVPPSQKHYG